jgi:hypothetical protein
VGRNLAPYRGELRAVGARVKAVLADGSSSVEDVAFARSVYDLMDTQLLRWPDAVLSNFDGQVDKETGYRNEKYWRVVMERVTEREIWPLRDEEVRKAHAKKRDEYERFAYELIQRPSDGPTRIEDNVAGIVYLVRPNRQLLGKLVMVLATELMKWFRQHEITKEFLAQPAKRGFFEFLETRTDMKAMVRLVDEQPLDVTAYEDPTIITKKTPTTAQMLIELGISLIPVVGEIVAAWELYSEHDLFGNPLDSVDRGIMAACLMLPMLGMVMKEGRVVYRETRLVLLHSGDAKDWARAMDSVSRLEAPEIRLLAQAEEALRVTKTLNTGMQRQAVALLPGMTQPTKVLRPEVQVIVTDAMAALRRVDPVFDTLDDLAMLRVLDKGPDPNKIKGQLLEELIETRLVPWLKTPHARRAFGLQDIVRPEGKLVFIPGHMICDLDGRQITDGIIALWEEGKLHIVMVFEAKSGRSASRELRIGKGGYSSLTDAQKVELRAEAESVFQRLKRRAELQGQPFKKKIEDIEKEIIEDIKFAEEGGQVRRDVERLSEDSRGKPAKIFIGDLPEPVPVGISPTRTKFVGIVPSDVDQIGIREAVQKLGYSFEIIGTALSSRKWKDIGKLLEPFATRLKPPAP